MPLQSRTMTPIPILSYLKKSGPSTLSLQKVARGSSHLSKLRLAFLELVTYLETAQHQKASLESFHRMLAFSFKHMRVSTTLNTPSAVHE